MNEWLTPIQKIALAVAIGATVGATIYTAITNWADNNDTIANPSYGMDIRIERTIEEVMV